MMKRLSKRVLALVLIISLLISIIPFSAFANSAVTVPLFKYGSYPSTKVSDNSLTDLLNNIPTEWEAYPYYAEGRFVEFMYYTDVSLGQKRYRGVKFTEYRPTDTNNSFTTESNFSKNLNYWFEYTDLYWYVLEGTSTKPKKLISKDIIDSQSFSKEVASEIINGVEIFPNNYNYSGLKEWIENSLKNICFNSAQQAETTDLRPITISEYNQYSNILGAASPTDYANIQGYKDSWWLSSSYDNNQAVYTINGNTISSQNANTTTVGVRLLAEGSFKAKNSGDIVTPPNENFDEGTASTEKLEYVTLEEGVDYTPKVDFYPDFNGIYHIYTYPELLRFREMVNTDMVQGEKFVLENNFDLGGREWFPIGNSMYPLDVAFDGQNHEIKNFTLSALKDSDNTYFPDDFYEESIENNYGFFGYIDGTTVENFGISDYKINSDVAKNFKEIGAFAAKITNGAVIKNCYANGEIVINFSDDEVDPVNEPDAIVFESEISGVEIPALFTSDNPLGQGLILDLRRYSGLIDIENNIYTQQNTTISGNIKSIKIIGSLGKRYRNLNFTIDTTDDFKLTFVDFDATNSTITINGEKNVYIKSTSEITTANNCKNSILAPDNKIAIDAPDSRLFITGKSELVISGGKGSNGKDGADGENGYTNDSSEATGKAGTAGTPGEKGLDGKVGINCKQLFATDVSVKIYGGNGGNGGDGGNGGSGTKGTKGVCKFDHNAPNGGVGGAGGNGGNGGDAGQGAFAIVASENIVCKNSQINLYSGDNGTPGNGGDGGNAGDGGDGGYHNNDYTWIVDDRYAGINGGAGGHSGKGGDSGKHQKIQLATESKIISMSGSVSTFHGDYGSDAQAGEGGKCGEGGAKGRVDKMETGVWPWLDHWTKYGSDGSDCKKESENGIRNSIIIDRDIPIIQVFENFTTYKLYYGEEWSWLEADEKAKEKNCVLANLTYEDAVYQKMIFDSSGQYWTALNNSSGTRYGYITEESSFDDSISVPLFKLSKKVISGFIGSADEGTTIENCTNSLSEFNVEIDSVYPQYINKKSFIHESNGAIINCISAKIEDGKYVSFSNEESGLLDGQIFDGVMLSTDYYDDNGIQYNSGLEAIDNLDRNITKVSLNRYITGYDKNKNLGDIIIPEYVYSGKYITNVIGIEPNAFENCDTINSIIIGDYITYIGSNAFKNSSLSNIEISGSITNIFEGTFNGCTKLERIEFPYELEYIAEAALMGCSSLRELTIPFLGETEKDSKALAFLFGIVPNSLNTVNIGNKATSICEQAFKNSRVEKVTLGQNIEKIGNYAFSGCINLKDISLNYGLEVIGNYAFKGCFNLTEFIMPDSVKSIGKDILKDCNLVEKIHIGASLLKLPQNGFGIYKSASSLKEYTVSESNPNFCCDDYGILYLYRKANENNIKLNVIDVPKNADLTDYSIPETIIAISDRAFSYTNIKSINLSNLRGIGDNAFEYCTELTTICFNDDNLEDIYNEDGSLKQIKLTEELTVEALGVSYSTKIGNQAFLKCTNLQNIDLTSPHIKSIGKRAFADCGTNINYGESFANIFSLIKLGKGLRLLSSDAFEGDNIVAFYVDEENPVFAEKDGVLFEKTDDYYSLRICPNLLDKEKYEIPDEINSIPIKNIDEMAFYRQNTINAVFVKDNVTTISNRAFWGSGIAEIHIGKSAKLDTDYPAQVFGECKNLKKIVINNDNAYIRNLNDDGVVYSEDLSILYVYPANKAGSEYNLPEELKIIGPDAFENNNEITSLYVNSKGTSVYLGAAAFNNCSIKNIYFNDSLPPELPPIEAVLPNKTEVNFYYTDLVAKKWESDSRFLFDEQTGLNKFKVSANLSVPVSKFEADFDMPDTSHLGEDYYLICVLDSDGNELDGVTVSLSTTYKSGESYIDDSGNKISHKKDTVYTDSSKTYQGVKSVTNFYDNFPIDYSKSYQLRVQDNTGKYFPYVNNNFYLDEQTGLTYITLNKVATCSGVSLEYKSEASQKLNNADYERGSDFESIQYTVEKIDEMFGGITVADISSEPITINKWAVNSFKLNAVCNIEATDSVINCRLLQDTETGRKIIEKCKYSIEYTDYDAKKTGDIVITAETSEFATEKDIYLQCVVKPQNGNAYTIIQKLNVKIIDMSFTNWLDVIDLKFLTNKPKVTIADNVPLIGGTEISIDEELFKELWLNFEVGADYVKILLGNEDWGKTLKDNGYDYTGKADTSTFKKGENKLQNAHALSKAMFDPKIAEKKFDESHKIYVGGFVKAQYKGLNEDGTPNIEFTVDISLVMSYSFEEGKTIYTAYLPLRAEVKFGAKGEISLEFVFDNPINKSFDDIINDLGISVQFKTEVEVELKFGVGCKMISLGVYGGAKLCIVWDISTDPFVSPLEKAKLNQLYFEGDMGIYFKVNALFITFEKKWSVFGDAKGTRLVLYNREKYGDNFVFITEDINPLKINAMLYEQSNFVVQRSSVNLMNSSGIIDETARIEIENYDYSDIRIVDAGNKKYLIYQDNVCFEDYYDNESGKYTWYGNDDENYDSLNYQKIVYREIDENGNVSNDVHILDDNGLADGEFDTYYDKASDKLYVLYSQLREKLGNDFNEENISDYISGYDVKITTIGNTEEPTVLSNDEKYDLNLRLGEISGNITAAWEKTDYNDMFAEDKSTNDNLYNRLYSSKLLDGKWVTTCINNNIGTLVDLKIAENKIAYIVDTDNNLGGEIIDGEETVYKYDDKLIYSVTADNPAPTPETEFYGLYNGISVINGELVYSENGYLTKLSDKTKLINTQLPEKYEIITDKNGMANAIIFVDSKENASNVFGIFYDKENKLWGNAVKLTNLAKDYHITEFGATLLNDEKLMLTIAKNHVTKEQISTTNNGEDVKFTDYINDISLDKSVIISKDLGFTLDKPIFNANNVTPNTDISVTIPITNNSAFALTSELIRKKLEIKCDNNKYNIKDVSLVESSGEETEDILYSGHSGYISVTFNSLAPHNETLEIFVDGIKQTELKLWYSDISVSAKLVRMGDKYSIVYRVKNNGYLSNKFTLTANYVAEGTENKTVIGEQIEFNLLPNAFEFGTVELKDNLGNYYSGSYLVELSVNANDEFNTVNNTSQVAVNTNTVSQDIKNKFTEVITEATNFESGKIVYTNCSNASDSFTIILYALFDIDRNTVVNALDLLACRKKVFSEEECDLNADNETNILDLIKFKNELINNF